MTGRYVISAYKVLCGISLTEMHRDPMQQCKLRLAAWRAHTVQVQLMMHAAGLQHCFRLDVVIYDDLHTI